MRSSIVLAGAFALTMAGAATAQQPPPVDTPSTDRSAAPSSSPQATDWTAKKPTTGGAKSAGSHSIDAAACETGDRTTGRHSGTSKDCAPAKSDKGDKAKPHSSTTRDAAPTTTPKPSNATPPM